MNYYKGKVFSGVRCRWFADLSVCFLQVSPTLFSLTFLRIQSMELSVILSFCPSPTGSRNHFLFLCPFSGISVTSLIRSPCTQWLTALSVLRGFPSTALEIILYIPNTKAGLYFSLKMHLCSFRTCSSVTAESTASPSKYHSKPDTSH